jgi:hypothetical protein
MSMREGDAYARSSRPQIIFMQPSRYLLLGNTDPATFEEKLMLKILHDVPEPQKPILSWC